MKKKSLWQEIRKNYFFYLLALPGLIFLIMFNYTPIAGIYLAFEKYTFEGGLFGSEFVGLHNFRILFARIDDVIRATRNTLVLNMGEILFGTVLNVAVAIILSEINNERYRKITQTFVLFPHFLSWIVIGTVSDALLDDDAGLINQIIQLFGGEAVAWSMNAKYWWAIIIIVSIWKNFGYQSIVYYATVTGFDPGLYEAAEIDGASRLRRVWSITLPLLTPTIIIMLLLSIGNIMRGSLEQIMGMTKLSPFILETTDTITTYVYRIGMAGGNFGNASAVSLYQSIFGCVFVLGANMIVKKIDPDYALF
ncbi:MAG: sugar ABC transporter permease [Roseburia sp.]|nr:sugar ABC transporter permease [Roseburia sp.]